MSSPYGSPTLTVPFLIIVEIAMAIGWIDEIYKNADGDFRLQSIDDSHNGSAAKELSPGELPPLPWLWPSFNLDDKQFHVIQSRTHWSCQWCGVPWYYNSRHYKTLISPNGVTTKVFQSQQDGSNWIFFQDANTGRTVGRQQVPKSSDYHVHLRFENEGVFFDVINDDGSTLDALTQINDQIKGWITVLAPVLAAILKK